jgi:hypothetical protein
MADLRRRGFVGFVPVAELGEGPMQVPTPTGVYAIIREATGATCFLEHGDGGSWKGKDLHVGLDRLAAEWVPGVQTLYVGFAGSLRERVGLLVQFSRARGEKVMHWGGRLLWQVDGYQSLLVAWKEDPEAGDLEDDLLAEFSTAYGRLPFANLVRGGRRRTKRAL